MEEVAVAAIPFVVVLLAVVFFTGSTVRGSEDGVSDLQFMANAIRVVEGEVKSE
jgi:hypothetical protein